MGPNIIDAATRGFTPDNCWNRSFDAGTALNRIFKEIESPGIITNLAGTYYFKTPIVCYDKKIVCNANVILYWMGDFNETLFTFGGSIGGKNVGADKSHLSGIYLVGDSKIPGCTGFVFKNQSFSRFSIEVADCDLAFFQWADDWATKHHAYFNTLYGCVSHNCRTALKMDGINTTANIQPQSSTLRIDSMDASGACEVLFDLGEGANCCAFRNISFQTMAKSPIIVRTGKLGGSSRIELQYFETKGNKGQVIWNNDNNLLSFIDPYNVIQVIDNGQNNRFVKGG